MSTVARYHRGETAAHALAGVVEQAEHSGRAIRDTFPAAAVDFLTAQPVLVLAAGDLAGRTWTSLLTGPPGFLTLTGDRTLTVAGRVADGDPLGQVLQAPTRVGLLAIEPASRRRMRVNGRCEPVGDSLVITADQVYANCPKYIAQRRPAAVDGAPAPVPAATRSTGLDAAQRRLVGTADTFFVGTRSAAGDADASHRGGNPGFVTVHDETSLSWPDYTGNAMMMTLGNLLEEPSAGLLFPDWSTGGTLQLTGTARTEWHPGDPSPGEERRVHFAVDAVVQAAPVSPLRWSGPSPSRHNPPLRTGPA